MMNRHFPLVSGALAAVAIALASVSGVAAQNAASGPAAMPEGPGRDLVTKNCVTCHALDQVTNQHLNETQWGDVVDQMIGLGATLSDDERGVVVKYLSANYGTEEKKNANGGTGG